MKNINTADPQLIDDDLLAGLSTLDLTNYIPMASGKNEYTHNIKVTPFANGYHVAYNRPTSPWWDYAGILFVYDDQGNWRYARRTPNDHSGVVTIQLQPQATDKVFYAIQIQRSGNRTHIMPLVEWTH